MVRTVVRVVMPWRWKKWSWTNGKITSDIMSLRNSHPILVKGVIPAAVRDPNVYSACQQLPVYLTWRHDTLPSPTPYVAHRHTSLDPLALRVWRHLCTFMHCKQRRINHSGAPYQRKRGPFSHTRSQDFLWGCFSGSALSSPPQKKKLTTFFTPRYV